MRNFIWYEKYRPRTIDKMSLTPDVRKKIMSYIKVGQIPHLFFHGLQGSGKTTLARILIKELGAQSITLNASSGDRGVATMKTKVKNFAASQAPGSALKIVFLDEADGLTSDAQDALKNTVEKYSKGTRFILTANSKDKVIPPLKSRCLETHFASFPKKELRKYVMWILEQEGVEAKKKDINNIIARFYPDVRSVVNTVQACCSKGKLTIPKGQGFDVNPLEIGTALLKGDIRQAREKFVGLTEFVWLYKYLFNKFIAEIDDNGIRAEASIIVADRLYKDATVADREINITACLVELALLLELEVRL